MAPLVGRQPASARQARRQLGACSDSALAPLGPPFSCALAGMGPRSPAVMTAQTLEAMIATISDFFKKQPTGGKCNNCGAHNPTIKR